MSSTYGAGRIPRWGSYSRTLQFRSDCFEYLEMIIGLGSAYGKKVALLQKRLICHWQAHFYNVIWDKNLISFKLTDTAFGQTMAFMIAALFANFLAHMQWHQPFCQFTSSQSNQRVLNKQPIKSKSSKSVWNGVAIGIFTMEYIRPSALADPFILVKRA